MPDPVSSILLLKALDGLSARQTATAQNIANAGTPGYRPLQVSFEEALKAASGDGQAAQAVKPKLEVQPGGELRLDLEMATAASTSARYAALVDVLSRQLQISSQAASWGR